MSGIKTKVPSSWELVKLGDFVESQKGKKPKNEAKEESPAHPIPYVDIQAFEEKIVRTWTDGVGCNPCYESDFLMVWDGSRSGLVGKGVKGALGSTLVRINFPMMVNDYAYYFLQSKYQQINTRAKGSGTPHVDPDLLWNYDFPIPPLREQERIVLKIEELFSKLDNGIEGLELVKTQIAKYKRSLLKHMFSGGITKNWRADNQNKRLSSSDLKKLLNKSRDLQSKKLKKLLSGVNLETDGLGELPEGWVWVQIGDLVSDIDQGWSPKCLNQPASNFEWGVIKTTAIQHGKFLDGENKALPANLNPRPQHALEAGDILITRAGPRVRVGVCCLVRSTRGNLMNCDKVYRVRANRDVCRPEYIEGLLNSPNVLDEIEKMKSGINDSGVNLNQGAFLKLAVPLCSPSEQEEVLSRLDESLSAIKSIERGVELGLLQANMLRHSILQQAFSGQLVPQDPSDEPASELLSRIKAEITKLKPIKKKKS